MPSDTLKYEKRIKWWMRNTKRNIDFVTDVYSGKINRCVWGQNRELSLQKKYIQNVEERRQKRKWNPRNKWIPSQCNFQHVWCVIRQSIDTVFLVVVWWAGEDFESETTWSSMASLWRGDIVPARCCCLVSGRVRSAGQAGLERHRC